MCGILGSINFDSTGKYLDCIRHRGPDGAGEKTIRIGNNLVSLLHRRLSIVDLSEAGSQPMNSANNQLCIIFNGEIYNHLELKEKINGTSFRGHSDTETIVNYFNHFDILHHIGELNGIFAFALLDIPGKRLFLARDRFGVKPLYYSFSDDRLIFSSELKPIRAALHPDTAKGLLINSLRMRYTPSPFTIYENIKKVEPGQLLEFDLEEHISLKKIRFASSPSSSGSRKGELKNLTKEYGDLFVQAVERQLMADVEVGILLSGGIDSALVAAVAKDKTRKTIKAFTIGFEEDSDEVDEVENASQTASVLGLEHFYKRITFADLLGSIEKIAEIVEEPIATTSIIPAYFLSELAASHVKVVLSGQGADEPLGGYDKYKAIPFLKSLKLPDTLRKFTRFGRKFYNDRENLRRFITAFQQRDLIDAYMEFNSIASDEAIENLIAPSHRQDLLSQVEKAGNSIKKIWKDRFQPYTEDAGLFLYYDLRTSLADDLLMYTDKITMNFSLECRVPILDNDLIAFIESLDNSCKFNLRDSKIIHRAFAREYLPSDIINRKKLGFKSPTESWFRKNTDELKTILTTNKALQDIFSVSGIDKIIFEHQKGKNNEKIIFLLLNIFYLTEKTNQIKPVLSCN